ncbi:hypothetical protein NPIL_477111 [Nephila pilipes]|uniref:Uncharacterized protein n=1 Tax=Nephila pilipes TaxID=299642 RepID=A0A8X6PVD5_NEPPI|nr:hypothetical protein NPIL_477111 [Nephila pilipes]
MDLFHQEATEVIILRHHISDALYADPAQSETGSSDQIYSKEGRNSLIDLVVIQENVTKRTTILSMYRRGEGSESGPGEEISLSSRAIATVVRALVPSYPSRSEAILFFFSFCRLRKYF